MGFGESSKNKANKKKKRICQMRFFLKSSFHFKGKFHWAKISVTDLQTPKDVVTVLPIWRSDRHT